MNLVTFGLITLEITWVEIATLGTRGKKLAFSTNYLGKYWTDLYQIFRVDYLWVPMITVTPFCGRPRDIAMVTN